MKLFIAAAVLTFAFVSATTPSPDAPTGFDDKTNGMVDDATHQADLAKFDALELLTDGLGPLYNAQSCRECHQSPVSGAASQVTELRVGHNGPDGVHPGRRGDHLYRSVHIGQQLFRRGDKGIR